MAGRIAVMHKGRVIETGSRDEVLRAPEDPYTQRLITKFLFPTPTRNAIDDSCVWPF